VIAGFERLIVDLDWEIKPMLFGYYNAIFQGSEALARQFIVQRKVVLELFSSNSSHNHTSSNSSSPMRWLLSHTALSASGTASPTKNAIFALIVVNITNRPVGTHAKIAETD